MQSAKMNIFCYFVFLPLMYVVRPGAPLDCNLLTHIEPRQAVATNGSMLSYCQTTDDQCCTEGYINKLKNRILEDLQSGIQTELLGNNYDILNSTNNRIRKFVTSTFSEGFVSRLPGAYAINRGNTVMKMQALLENAYKLEDESITFASLQDSFDSVMHVLLTGVTREYITVSGPFPPTNLHVNCIVNQLIDNFVNKTVEARIINALHDFLSSLTLMDSITRFYQEQFVPAMSAIPPSEDCIRGFISLSCAACTKAIPGLCHSVCGQLALGCFSSHRRALIGQLNILWNVTAQIIQVIESQAQKVLELVQEPRDLLTLDFEDTGAVRAFIMDYVFSPLPGSCLFFFQPHFFNAQPSPVVQSVLFPADIANNAAALSGSFEYTPSGPSLCETYSNTNCWNGTQVLEIEEEETFTTDDILEQDNNPVVSFNRSELIRLAASIGTPVSDYFQQDMIKNITPESVVIPSGASFTIEIASAPTTIATSDNATSMSTAMMITPSSQIIVAFSTSFVPTETDVLATVPSSAETHGTPVSQQDMVKNTTPEGPSGALFTVEIASTSNTRVASDNAISIDYSPSSQIIATFSTSFVPTETDVLATVPSSAETHGTCSNILTVIVTIGIAYIIIWW